MCPVRVHSVELALLSWGGQIEARLHGGLGVEVSLNCHRINRHRRGDIRVATCGRESDVYARCVTEIASETGVVTH